MGFVSHRPIHQPFKPTPKINPFEGYSQPINTINSNTPRTLPQKSTRNQPKCTFRFNTHPNRPNHTTPHQSATYTQFPLITFLHIPFPPPYLTDTLPTVP